MPESIGQATMHVRYEKITIVRIGLAGTWNMPSATMIGGTCTVQVLE
jgi:hypothetical protein